MNEWINCDDKLPPENEVVKTKCEDCSNKNIQELLYYGGNWWSPDHRMMMSYHPTHWRFLNE